STGSYQSRWRWIGTIALLEMLRLEASPLSISISPPEGSGCKLCPPNWLLHRDKCYWVSKEKNPWNKSRDDCSRRSSRLPVLRDQDEMVNKTSPGDMSITIPSCLALPLHAELTPGRCRVGALRIRGGTAWGGGLDSNCWEREPPTLSKHQLLVVEAPPCPTAPLQGRSPELPPSLVGREWGWEGALGAALSL
uniref:C-type lectin domain-containing protein n=1 Tax=Terrapene triunguis TaxID=2587831 RepID=A0A674JS79_9SAUR